MAPGEAYTGIDNLEVMESAVKYRRYLEHAVTRALGPASSQPRILDFGAGSGTMADALSQAGYRVSCLEPDATLRNRLASAGHPVGDDLDALGPPDGFDVAYSLNVLEHIDDDVAALRGVHRVLRPGGSLVLYVPAFQVLYSSMDAKVGHLRRYRRHGLVTVVEAAGFVVESCRYADSLGFAAALAYRAFGNRQGDLGGRSVGLYDRYAFPVSAAVDHLTGRVVGKNLLLYARRP